jgi:hypothetical protein
MLNIIIFSKDSPMQLYALLESMSYFWKDHPKPTIIYETSDEKYIQGYYKVFLEYPAQHRMVTNNFHSILMSELYKTSDHLMFIKDDNIFIRPFRDNYINYLNNPTIHSFSNKLGLNINYDSKLNKKIELPAGVVFNINNYIGEFNQLFSLDGNIFSYHKILDVLHFLKYNNIEELENQLYINDEIKTMYTQWFMAMNTLPCIIKMPRTTDKEQLNKMFLAGKKILLTPYFYLETNSTVINPEEHYQWK